MKLPSVSVVMSVYNGGVYLAEAVESILNQTLDDFEFIIINDGSTDKSLDVLTKYAAKDKRINLLSQKNQGLVASLNRGIKAAKGQYIARQDADDKSDPERLEKQLVFLKERPGTVIVGSSVNIMDSTGKILHRHAVLLNDPELRQELLVRSPFAHGTVIFKRQAALDAGLYQADSWPVEDYDLWLRLSAYGQLSNLDEFLYTYREHSKGISIKHAKLQAEKLLAVQANAWQQPQRFLPGSKIRLSSYRKLEMGQQRIERIFSNATFIARIAANRGYKQMAARTLMFLGRNPLAYRKAAGKLKRRIKR